MGLPMVTFAIPATAITMAMPGSKSVTLDYVALSDPKKAPGPTSTISLAEFLVPTSFLPGDPTQVEMGDPNGDGVFGAELGGAVIQPGQPLKSYLVLRVLAPLAVGPGNPNTNVTAMATTEPQMPIANQRYWDLGNDFIALWCWVSGMKDPSKANGPIDYQGCDLSQMPKPAGQDGLATTFSSIYSTILQPNCAGPCHHAGSGQPTHLHMDSLQQTYDTLLGINGDKPSESMLPFVTPNDPTQSFLYLKVGPNPPFGERMPAGGMLPQESIDAIGTWITQGGNNN
jgi:hypothetical protein